MIPKVVIIVDRTGEARFQRVLVMTGRRDVAKNKKPDLIWQVQSYWADETVERYCLELDELEDRYLVMIEALESVF